MNNEHRIPPSGRPLAPIVFTIVCAFVGLITVGFTGSVVGGALGFLIGTVRRLAWRLDLIERATGDTEPMAVATGSAALATTPPPADRTATEPPAVPAPTPTPATTPSPAPEVIPTPLPPEIPWTPEPAAPAPPSAGAQRVGAIGRKVAAFFTTGNVVAKAGAVILFFGLAFLVRYATQQFSFPIELRLAGVGLVGVTLLGLGWRLRQRPDAFGLVLQGTGVAVLYLTVFAAARLYSVLPLAAALVLMIVMVAATCVLAVRQDSQALAVLALSGGFLAPVLTSTGSGNHVALFSYFALLNAGIFALAWFRAWRVLNWLGFAFIFSIGTLWGQKYYTPEHFATTQPFLILFFLFFVAVGLLFTRRNAAGWRGMVDGSLIFGTPIVAFGLQAALVRELPFGLAYSALVTAAVYVGLTAWLHRQGALATLLGQSFLALGIIFASLTLPFAFDNQQWTAAAWALEGAGLIWVGARQSRLLPRVFGLLLQIVAPLAYFAPGPVTVGSRPVANGHFLTFAILAVAALFSAYVLSRHKQHLLRIERLLHGPFLTWGVLVWLAGGTHEISRYASDRWTLATTLLLLAGTSAALTGIALKCRWPAARVPGWLLGPIVALLAIERLADLGSSSSPLEDHGWLAWPMALAIVVWQLWIDERDPSLPRPLVAAAHAGSLLLFAFLTAWSMAAAIELDNPLWGAMLWGLVPATLAVFLQRLGPRLRWPVGAYREAYLGAGLAPLMAWLLVWVVAANRFTGDASPLPSLPLLNPLDLVQAFALLAVADWGRRQSAFRLAPQRRMVLLAVAATAFVWLAAVTARFAHWTYGVPYRVEAMVDSPIFHTALSILWTVMAITAMTVSSRRNARPVWIAGATLLALVIVKLVLVDLSASGTLARIISFLSVGGLTLAVGYLAPLPPRTSDDAARSGKEGSPS